MTVRKDTPDPVRTVRLYQTGLRDGLFPLIERCYERELELLRREWQCFLVPLRKQREWFSDRDVELHRKMTIDGLKKQAAELWHLDAELWHLDAEWAADYRKHRLQSLEIIAPQSVIEDVNLSGRTDPYAAILSPVSHRIRKLQNDGYLEDCDDYLCATYLEMKRCRAEEIAKHGYKQWQGYNPERKSQVMKLYVDVAADCGARFGYSVDRQLSTRKRVILSKPAANPWRYTISLVHQEAMERYQPPSKPRNKRWWQELYPEVFCMRFGIERVPHVGNDINWLGGIMEWFFPVEEPPLSGFYRQFATPEEFELVTRFYFDMFEIIHEELENICIDAAKILM